MTQDGVKRVEDDGRLYAIVVRADYSPDEVEFLTDDDSPQQLGLLSRPEGYEVEPHKHNRVSRTVKRTQETVLVRSGRTRVSLYARDGSDLGVFELGAGDIIFLADGGHEFEMLEPTDILEVKQGPYLGTDDKSRFNENETK